MATDLGSFGEIDSLATTLNWQPAEWLRLSVLRRYTERAPEHEQVSGAITITPNVRYFDPLRNETVNVSTSAGVFPGSRTRRCAPGGCRRMRPVPGRDLHLTAEYTANRFSDQIGYTPPPTAAVVAAFPDRFARDAAGHLVSVDTRPVNFARQTSRQLRLGATGAMPLRGATDGQDPDGAKPVLQFSLAHIIVLSNTATIRDGLPTLDLLAGEVAGVGTGRQRTASEASVALTDRGSGLRLSADRLGRSFLQIGPSSGGNLLTFGSLTRFDAKVFADTARLFPRSTFARNGRIALSVENIANARQQVSDGTGATPFGYQPAYRDPIGRTITLELRRTF